LAGVGGDRVAPGVRGRAVGRAARVGGGARVAAVARTRVDAPVEPGRHVFIPGACERAARIDAPGCRADELVLLARAELLRGVEAGRPVAAGPVRIFAVEAASRRAVRHGHARAQL